ncbi:MAG: hypothetical protein AAB392_01100, partial [Patescibacteria group bacterium]
MFKKIVPVIILLVLAGLILFFTKDKPTLENPKPDTEENPNIPTPELETPKLPLKNDDKTLAWNLFQKYLSYNKAKDIEGIKTVVYKISDVCLEPKTRIDCEARMAAAYGYGSTLKEEDFTNVWSDAKQTILSTEFWVENKPDMDLVGRFRSIIFFVRDEKGVLKVLSFSPFQGGATNVGEASMEEVADRVVRWTEDEDM